MLEVIELRSVKKDKPQILELIDKLTVNCIKKEDIKIKVFVHSIIETDFSIHLYYKTSSHKNFGSKLGYELTSYLKEYGLVSHNKWVDRNLDKENNEE